MEDTFATKADFNSLKEQTGIMLNNAVEHLKNWFDITLKKRLEDRFEEFGLTVKQGFNTVDERFDRVEIRLDDHDRRFDAIDQRFGQVDERFDELALMVKQGFDGVDEKFVDVSKQFDKVNERFDLVEERLEIHSHQNRFLAKRITSLELKQPA